MTAAVAAPIFDNSFSGRNLPPCRSLQDAVSLASHSVKAHRKSGSIMAAPDPRTRDQPDIRARISIHDESPHYIRQRLQISDQTRRLPRSQQSWHPPETSELVHHAVLGKNNAPPHPYRPGRGSDGHSLDPAWPSDRSNSLDSLSTLQRGAEAASLSMYRGSPISSIRHPYFSPTLSSLAGHHTQDPCPPRQQLRVETLSAQRKYHKALKKSLKRDQKEQRRAQKVEAQLRRASLAAEVAAAREKDVAGWGDSLPLRSRSTRAIASQIKKTLSFKGPLSKLSRGRRQASVPPTLDDFDSKQEIHDYLNPNPATPFVDIAELPAELPQYTPFENSTRTQDNEPLTLSDGNPLAKEKANGSLSDQPNARQETSQTPPRSMRCDACQSPIRLNQIYYHCSICENGDRILCSSCNQAGWSCRHMITEKVRDVTRAAPSQARGATVPKGGASRHDADHYVTSMAVLPGLDHSTESGHCTESSVQFRMSKIMPRACHNVAERKKLSLTSLETLANGYVEKYQARETELRRLERDLVLREKEIALLERGASIRERKAALREQEAALTIKKQLVTIQLQSAMVGRTGEAWTGIGSQFQDLADVSPRFADSGLVGLTSLLREYSLLNLAPRRTNISEPMGPSAKLVITTVQVSGSTARPRTSRHHSNGRLVEVETRRTKTMRKLQVHPRRSNRPQTL